MNPESRPFWPAARHRLSAWTGSWSRRLTSGRRGRWIGAAFLALSLIVIARVVIANWPLLASYEWQFRPAWLIGVVAFFILDLLLAGWAWHVLMRRLAHYDNFRRSLKICWSANLARRMPTPVWYIASRAVLYEAEGVSKVTTSLMSGLELAFFLTSGAVTTLLTLPFWVVTEGVAGAIGRSWLLLVALGFSLLLVHPRLLEKLLQWLGRRPPAEALRWRDTISWVALYVLTWVLGALVLLSVISLFQPVPLAQWPAVLGIWSLAGTISLAGAMTISGIGLREISLVLLLTPITPAPVALVIAILIRLIWFSGEMASALASFRL
jgi:hypothetical protein